jgi:hypothetical protein
VLVWQFWGKCTSLWCNHYTFTHRFLPINERDRGIIEIQAFTMYASSLHSHIHMKAKCPDFSVKSSLSSKCHSTLKSSLYLRKWCSLGHNLFVISHSMWPDLEPWNLD